MTKLAAGIVPVLLIAAMGTAPAGADGPVVGPAHLVGHSVSASSGGAAAAIAFDGTNFFVVWTKPPGGSQVLSDVYGARVSPDGTVLDPSGIPLRAAGGFQGSPDVVFDGTSFLAVWSNGGQVEATRVAPDGTKRDATPLVLGPGGGPQVATTGSLSLVVWTAEDGIHETRIEPDGSVLNPAPGRLLVPRPPGSFGIGGIVASNGSDFLVSYGISYETSSENALLKVDVSGNPGVSRSVDRVFRLASDGVDYLGVWSQCVETNPWGCEFGGDRDIFARKITASDLTLGPITTVATTSPSQTLPRVVFNAGRYLIAYRRQAVEYPDGDEGPPRETEPVDVRATLLDADGTTVHAGGFLIESDTPDNRSFSADVTVGPGDDFGVVYLDQPSSAPPVHLRTVSPK